MKDDMSRRELTKRVSMIVVGLVLAFIGVPLLILPGPGLALILIGAGLIGEGTGFDARGWLESFALKFTQGSGGTAGRTPVPASGGERSRASRHEARRAVGKGTSGGEELS